MINEIENTSRQDPQDSQDPQNHPSKNGQAIESSQQGDSAAEKTLVHASSVKGAYIVIEGVRYSILDISFSRLVVSADPVGSIQPDPSQIDPVWTVGESKIIRYHLDRIEFDAPARLVHKASTWQRFALEGWVPSQCANLRAFLSPRRVGESIRQDWKSGSLCHYHGLNESELWVDPGGPILFSYLDSENPSCQMLLRVHEDGTGISVGSVRRIDYIGLEKIEGVLPLLPISERHMVRKLGECRDILTNFRPVGPSEYQLKQRLLRAISDYLYSASFRAESHLAKTTVRSVSSPQTTGS